MNFDLHGIQRVNMKQNEHIVDHKYGSGDESKKEDFKRTKIKEQRTCAMTTMVEHANDNKRTE